VEPAGNFTVNRPSDHSRPASSATEAPELSVALQDREMRLGRVSVRIGGALEEAVWAFWRRSCSRWAVELSFSGEREKAESWPETSGVMSLRVVVRANAVPDSIKSALVGMRGLTVSMGKETAGEVFENSFMVKEEARYGTLRDPL